MNRAAGIRAVLATLAILALSSSWLPTNGQEFRRGDSNGDGVVDVVDAVTTLGYLFQFSQTSTCLDAVDADDSGELDVSDPVFTLAYLFLGGALPPEPGPIDCGVDPTADAYDCAAYSCGGSALPGIVRIGHLLNRIAYGPSPDSVADVEAQGIPAFVAAQLVPASIADADPTLIALEASLFEQLEFYDETPLIDRGALWQYWKGTAEPPVDWTALDFDTTSWLSGVAGIGYGDGDDETVIDDMRYNYTSLYFRREFDVDDVSVLPEVVLRIDYDDAFVAYLNGVEFARSDNIVGTPPAYDATASEGHEAGKPEIFALDTALLATGVNVLAIQGHNVQIDSNDFSMHPELVIREPLGIPPRTVIGGIGELKKLVHVRGVLSERQLQTVLAEFWENHFTTDYDKVAQYLNGLADSSGADAMSEDEADRQAAQIEYDEYQFFTDHALGNFGDLLLYSATSPSMLIYLDNVLNNKIEPNENYAREIMELSTMGVDNGYTQDDIVELARCFTGWTIVKVPYDQVQPFPASATNPPILPSILFDENVLVEVGDTWRYIKGTTEPSPIAGGGPGTAWTEIGYDDSAWLEGATSIGYGDGDDATVLDDMRYNYASIYLRKTFDIADVDALGNLVFDVDYDDGYVLYLNGVEVARSDSMKDAGIPPAYGELCYNHEAGEHPDFWSLDAYKALLVDGTNVLALQVHNVNLDSPDLSILPRLIERTPLPGGIELGDPAGFWRFRFDPDLHDTDAKALFEGTPYQIDIPAGRLGVDGVLDALDVIDGLAAHPSTAEFVGIELIQKFVSDDISLATVHDLSAPLELRILLADVIGAWYSTSPPGDIRTVMATILDADAQQGAFWHASAYKAKVRTPIEHINAALRVLDADFDGNDLVNWMRNMGMSLFTRDEPDGWSELGSNWIGTGGLLDRINFARRLAHNQDGNYNWQTLQYLADHGLVTATEIIDYFDALIYQGTLSDANKSLLLQFIETDESGSPDPLDPTASDYDDRVEELVGLLFSMPQWIFQ